MPSHLTLPWKTCWLQSRKGGPKYNKLKSHTLFRSESVKPLDKSLFNRSRINSITVFGSMKAVDDISVTNHARREGAWDESTKISKALPDVRNCEASVWSGMITIATIPKATIQKHFQMWETCSGYAPHVNYRALNKLQMWHVWCQKLSRHISEICSSFFDLTSRDRKNLVTQGTPNTTWTCVQISLLTSGWQNLALIRNNDWCCSPMFRERPIWVGRILW